MMYTSVDNIRIKQIKKLQQKKYRDEVGLFLVEGEHLVLEAYKKGYLKTLILNADYKFKIDTETIRVTANVLKYLSELNTQSNIMGICYKQNKNISFGNRVLVLDGIQDPGNLGTIIRSAVAFNIATIILSPDTVDLYNSKVIRASQGLLFQLNIIESPLGETINKLKMDGYKILGTKVDGGKSVENLEKLEKFVIIMGNEGKGLSKEVQQLCNDFLYIKMNKECESLNVAIATSIILYELNK